MRTKMTCGVSVAVALIGCAAFAGGTAAATLNALYAFCSQSGCPDGDQPYGGVTLLSDHRLIGTTGFGGKYNDGTVFALDDKSGAWQLHSLKSFCVGTPPSCQPYQGPIVTLVEDISGNIYGSTYFGGKYTNGAVFELEAKGKDKYALHYLYSFNGTDGAGPWELSYAGQGSGVRYDGKSPLYGTTIAGGTGSAGIVFSLTPDKRGWTLSTLYNFCSATNCTDGGLPRAGVIVDPSGALYGTTSNYGAASGGTIFGLTNNAGTWSEATLYSFCSASGCSDGSGPFAGLAEDSSGTLYGTTYFGGVQGDGVAFKFAPGSARYSALHTFCSQTNCTDGSEPAAAVTLDSSGNIFGTTGRGGDGNYGVMFEIAKGTYKRLYSYCSASGCSDGGYPYGTLALDSAGRVYGTTQYGGGHGLGEVYRMKP